MQALPLLLLIGLILFPDPVPKADDLENFARVQGVTNQEVYIVDQHGVDRFGALVEASEQGLRLRIGRKVVPFEKDTILAVDRHRDRVSDGVITGALFGLAVGLVMSQGEAGHGAIPANAAFYGLIGYALDRNHEHRTPVYRAPAPALTASFRF